MAKINLTISTPERVVLQDEVDQLTVPTQMGEITILPDHRPLLVNLAPGVMLAKTNGDEIEMAISGGFLELHSNKLTVLADTAERAEEIDLERAEEARRRAEKLRQERARSVDEFQYAEAASILEKQVARVKLARKYRTKRGFKLGDDE